jgi:uncharacterized surface protein with fasciclin (FAS1) repeats
MKTTALLTLLSLGLLVAPARAGSHQADLVQTALEDGRFTTLATALQAAGLVDALRADGPLTVFAPTDEAFGRLPEGTLETLLKPENKDQLTAILTYHVVAGRVPSSALLSTSSAKSLGGPSLSFGLTVEGANVIQADVSASNGVIHVIDAVLLPPKLDAMPYEAAMGVIETAIRRGAPIYNDGDAEACAEIYTAAARELHGMSQLPVMDRMSLEAALNEPSHGASDRAWKLRHAFDHIGANASFEPKMEAPLPKGFPGPGPVGQVVVKEYPQYRAARADGSNSFWMLFRHIKKNEVQMTTPVQMTMSDSMRQQDMAFLYEAPDQGDAGRQGGVQVLDLEPLTVLSVGVRGSRSAEMVDRARSAIEERLAADGLERAGDWRLMGYNSPMVPASKRFWELQLPVRPATN